ncbi:hypothetical protein LTR17_007750 [Elasticomyces elasticus]|nr:hypothetical protein LTR17_007750 [Elasticomyces elasticus]
MKFSTIALACTMARFATAAWPHDDLPRGQGIDYEGIHAFSKSIAKAMAAFNATVVEERIFNITAALDKLAPYVCEGKVSPFTPACEKAAVQHAYLLRETREAYKIQVESNRGLWVAWDEPSHKEKFRREWGVRLQGLETQQLEASEAASNLEAGMYPSAKRLNACKASSKDAEEMCNKARPLTKDELKTEVALLHQDVDRLRGMRKEHESSLALNEAAGKTKCAHAIIATDELTKSMMEVTQEQIELHEAFISVFEKALESASEAAIYNLTGPWEELRVVANEPMKELLSEFARSLYGMFEACDIGRDKDEFSDRIAHDEL